MLDTSSTVIRLCRLLCLLIFATPSKTIIKIVLQIFNGQISLRLPEGLFITLVIDVLFIQILRQSVLSYLLTPIVR